MISDPTSALAVPWAVATPASQVPVASAQQPYMRPPPSIQSPQGGPTTHYVLLGVLTGTLTPLVVAAARRNLRRQGGRGSASVVACHAKHEGAPDGSAAAARGRSPQRRPSPNRVGTGGAGFSVVRRGHTAQQPAIAAYGIAAVGQPVPPRSHVEDVDALEAMPSVLAQVTHATLCELCDEGVRLPESELSRRMDRQVFNNLRADACSTLAVLDSMSSDLTSAAELQSEVRTFLVRSWAYLVESTSGRRRVSASPQPYQSERQLSQMAELFGHFLASVPERGAQDGFRIILSQWAAGSDFELQALVAIEAYRHRGSTMKAELEEMLSPIFSPIGVSTSREDKLRRAHRALGVTTRSMLRHDSDGEQDFNVVAKAASIVASIAPELMSESAEVINLALQRGASIHQVWASLLQAPPLLRLSFLAVVAERTEFEVVNFFGDHAAAVARLCADVAEASDSGSKLNKTGKQQMALVLNRLSTNFPLYVDPSAALQPSKVLALARGFGKHLGFAAPWLLRTLVRDMTKQPSRFSASDFIAVAVAAKSDIKLCKALGGALPGLLLYLSPQMLLEVMVGMPLALNETPPAFRQGLKEACTEHEMLLQALQPKHLSRLIEVWSDCGYDKVPVPESLMRLLPGAVDFHLLALDARRLVALSRLLNNGSASTAQEVVRIWRKWAEGSVHICMLRGWGRFYDALREVCRWRELDGGGRTTLGQAVLQGGLAEGLADVAQVVPLELCMEISRLVPSTSLVACMFREKMEEKVRCALRGVGGRLPLVVAVAVANGETLIKVEKGSTFWEALVLLIADSLKGSREIDLFCRSQPRMELRSAVIEALGGWRSLELSMSLSA
mmetsp:Transcript_128330/g.411268  ORF Transcript_128330/g.411268 Transcript_128330/m.411268 type:complete len:846 (+) Transcript_128330:136-2673(+)